MVRKGSPRWRIACYQHRQSARRAASTCAPSAARQDSRCVCARCTESRTHFLCRERTQGRLVSTTCTGSTGAGSPGAIEVCGDSLDLRAMPVQRSLHAGIASQGPAVLGNATSNAVRRAHEDELRHTLVARMHAKLRLVLDQGLLVFGFVPLVFAP